MNPIFFCNDCRKNFEAPAGPGSIIIEQPGYFDMQNIGRDESRISVVCPGCQGKNLQLKANGSCTVLKRPTVAKARDLKRIRTKGLPSYVRHLVEKMQT